MLWSPSLAFRLIIACLPVLLASELTPQLNDGDGDTQQGDTQQGLPQIGQPPAPAPQDPASISQSADDSKMLNPPNEVSVGGKDTQSDVMAIEQLLNDLVNESADILEKEKKEEPVTNEKIAQQADSDLVAANQDNVRPSVIKAEETKIVENIEKEIISETIQQNNDNDEKPGIAEVPEFNSNGDELSPNKKAPMSEQSQDNVTEKVAYPKKIWSYLHSLWQMNEFRNGISGVGGLIIGGVSGYFFGKSGRSNASSEVHQNESKKAKEEDKLFPNRQQIVYILIGASIMILLFIFARICAWCCCTKDKLTQRNDEKKSSRKSRKTRKSKEASMMTPNSQTPSTMETLSSTQATSAVGSKKKSVKVQSTPITSTYVSRATSAVPSGVKSKNANKLPSAMAHSMAPSVAASKASVLSVFSSATTPNTTYSAARSTTPNIYSKVKPRSCK